MKHFAVSATNRKYLFTIIAVAAVLRICMAAFFHPPLISDDRDYDAIARSLVHGQGFSLDGAPTAYRLPGYPLLLAGSYGVFGDVKTPIRFFQAAADVLSCLLLFSIGKKMFSESVGLIAAAALAVFPIQVLYVSHLMTETLFTTVLLLIVWVVVIEEDDLGLAAASVILGALTGVGLLLRTTVALIPAVIFLYRYRRGIPFTKNAGGLMLIVATAAIVVAPWLVRNYDMFHRLSMTSNAGVNFWMGNHSGASGAYSFPRDNNPLAAVADDFDRSDLGFQRGLDFIRSHPLEYCLIEGKKFAHFFAADYWLLMTMEYKPEWATSPNAAAVFSQLSLSNIILLHLPYVVAVLLGSFGLICPARGSENRFFLLRGILLYWLVIHLVFYADARYRFPVVPLFILAAAYAWFIIRQKAYQLSKPRLVGLTLLCLLYFGGWTGEIVTLVSKTSSHIPVAGQNYLNSDESAIRRAFVQNSLPKTR